MKWTMFAAAGLTALLALGESAAAQYAPTVPMMPPPGKPYSVFQQDDAVCQQWANQRTAYDQQQAGNQAVGGAVAGALGGALIGGIVGGGRGAAIGAGAGAVTGGMAGAAEAQNSQYYGQQHFDSLYQQCMIGRGNQVRYQAPPPNYQPAQPSYQSAPPPPPPGSAPSSDYNNYDNDDNDNY